MKLLGVEVKGSVKSSEELGLSTYDNHDSSDEENQETAKRLDKKSSKTRSRSPTTAAAGQSATLLSSSTSASKEGLPLERRLNLNGKQNVPTSFTLYRKVNLDITCLIAFVSATSNGGCNYVFEDQFLKEQAEAERKNPVKDVLNIYFKG